MARKRFSAVIFDIGGVIVDSPFSAIAKTEQFVKIAPGALNKVFAGDDSCSFARLERGEIVLESFHSLFEGECKQAGFVIDSKSLFAAMSSVRLRPIMLDLLQRLRKEGYKTGAITNNWKSEAIPEYDIRELTKYFDIFVESCVEGVRKPDARIYQLACKKLGIEPSEAIFLDDIGRNVKAAKTLGMETILVKEPEDAVKQVEALLNLPARSKL